MNIFRLQPSSPTTYNWSSLGPLIFQRGIDVFCSKLFTCLFVSLHIPVPTPQHAWLAELVPETTRTVHKTGRNTAMHSSSIRFLSRYSIQVKSFLALLFPLIVMVSGPKVTLNGLLDSSCLSLNQTWLDVLCSTLTRDWRCASFFLFPPPPPPPLQKVHKNGVCLGLKLTHIYNAEWEKHGPISAAALPVVFSWENVPFFPRTHLL